jgi:hypothetical protein
MRINEEIRKAVVYLCSRDPDSNEYTLQGTATIVVYHDNGWPQSYLITARHVVRDCQYPLSSKGDTCVYVRVNRLGRSSLHTQITYEWWVPEDSEIDIAVAPFDWRFDSETAAIPANDFGLPGTRFDKYAFGIGDDLYVVGLFLDDPGTGQNRPLLRTGTLAAEADRSNPHAVYLAELHSTGGLSGSPVWAVFGEARNPDGTPNDQFQAFLVGVIRGHHRIAGTVDSPTDSLWTERLTRARDHLSPTVRRYYQELSRGIATVTPIWHAMPLLTSEAAVEHRIKKAQLAASKDVSFPEPR